MNFRSSSTRSSAIWTSKPTQTKPNSDLPIWSAFIIHLLSRVERRTSTEHVDGALAKKSIKKLLSEIIFLEHTHLPTHFLIEFSRFSFELNICLIKTVKINYQKAFVSSPISALFTSPDSPSSERSAAVSAVMSLVFIFELVFGLVRSGLH